jgi:hypothetical protein
MKHLYNKTQHFEQRLPEAAIYLRDRKADGLRHNNNAHITCNGKAKLFGGVE